MKREEKKEFYTLSDEDNVWFLASPYYSPMEITNNVFEAREFSTEAEAIEYCKEYDVVKKYRNIAFVSIETQINKVKNI